jgi:hypothetical protein
LLLTEDGDQYIGNAYFAPPARLHLKNSPLQYALKAQRGLHFAIILAGLHARRRFVNMPTQLFGQSLGIGITGLEYLAHARRVDDRQQQMLYRQKLMAGFARLRKSSIQASFKFR